MSKISNTLPQQGDALSSTDLNSLFSTWPTATTTAMNEDNAANQSVDITNLNLQASSGKAGFILKDMQGHDITNASGVTLPSEQDTGTPSFSDVTNSTFSFGASGKTIATNDTLRIYYNLRAGNIAYATPFGSAVNEWQACWVVWLEYAAAWTGSPSSWTPVPGQGNFATSINSSGGITYYGLRLNNMRGTTIIPHQMGELSSGGSAESINTTQQDFNGQYYMKNSGSNLVWYGLRLRIGGVLWAYNHSGNNYIAFKGQAPPVAAGNILTYYNGNIAYFQMTSN